MIDRTQGLIKKCRHGVDDGDEVVHTVYMNTTQTPADTARTHEFLVSGCRNQFHGNHDHADCWARFMEFNGRPSETTYAEFYA